jgi:hypothetical protein
LIRSTCCALLLQSHVIITGVFDHTSLKTFLEELFHEGALHLLACWHAGLGCWAAARLQCAL